MLEFDGIIGAYKFSKIYKTVRVIYVRRGVSTDRPDQFIFLGVRCTSCNFQQESPTVYYTVLAIQVMHRDLGRTVGQSVCGVACRFRLASFGTYTNAYNFMKSNSRRTLNSVWGGSAAKIHPDKARHNLLSYLIKIKTTYDLV